MPSKDSGFNYYREKNRNRRSSKNKRKNDNKGRSFLYILASLIGVISMLVELFTAGIQSKKSDTTKKE